MSKVGIVGFTGFPLLRQCRKTSILYVHLRETPVQNSVPQVEFVALPVQQVLCLHKSHLYTGQVCTGDVTSQECDHPMTFNYLYNMLI